MVVCILVRFVCFVVLQIGATRLMGSEGSSASCADAVSLLFLWGFIARSKHNLRFYAIKVLNKERIVKMKQIEHTNNEMMMLESVQHPFIINLWGSFQDTGNLYMVMDFVPGGELFTLLRRSNVRVLMVPDSGRRTNDSSFSILSASLILSPSSTQQKWLWR